MQPCVLFNSKWKFHTHTTGVQRYASELTDELQRLGFDFDECCPKTPSTTRSSLWEQRVLPKRAKNYETLFCPANMAPLKLSKKTRLVVTIHCLRYLAHPESYSKKFAAWYRFAIPRVIDRANLVLTVSDTMAREIKDTFPQAHDKVRVVYPGVSSVFAAGGQPYDFTNAIGTYWVYIGNTTHAKNIQVVLEAFEQVDRSHSLVLIGIDKNQLGSLQSSQLTDRLLPMGHINNPKEIASILRGAVGLLSPSLYESFDLPTIESMAVGTPVIASETDVHREICSEAALFVTADNPQRWAAQMSELATNSQLHKQYSDRGLERANKFSWTRSASHVIDFLSNVRKDCP
jgi:glycosyltransferase involved in cell wall biosynthesis